VDVIVCVGECMDVECERAEGEGRREGSMEEVSRVERGGEMA